VQAQNSKRKAHPVIRQGAISDDMAKPQRKT